MSRIAITDVYTPPEVDLWGHVFELRPVTKHLEEKLGPLQEQLEEKLDKAKDGAEAVGLLGQLFDLQLKRVGGDGPQKKPSTLLKQKWDSSELSVRQIENFLYALAQAETETRPT